MFAKLCLFFLLSGITRDQVFTNRKVVLTYAEFDRSQKHYSQAEQRLRNHLQTDATDAEAWIMLGKTLEDSKKVDLALESYQSAVRVSPKDLAGSYHYVLADFYARNSRLEEAKKELQEAMRDWRAKPAARLALKQLSAGSALPLYFEEPDYEKWSGSLGFAAGYDSNVLFLSDTTLDSVSISETHSPSFLLFGSLKYQNQILGGKLDAKAFSSATLYTAEEAISFDSLSERLGFNWDWEISNKIDLGFGTSADINFLNTDDFEYFNSTYRFFPELMWKLTPYWKTKWTANLSYLHFNQDNPGTGNERSGYSVNPELVNEFYLSDSVLSLGAGYERIWAEGENFNLHSYQVPFSITFQLPAKLVSVCSFRWALNNYSDSSDSRTDHSLQPGFMIGRTFKDTLSTYIQYSFTRNISSTDSAQYSKHTASLLVNYAFK